MSDNPNPYEEDDQFMEMIRSFENMLETGDTMFWDANDLIDIIEYYLMEEEAGKCRRALDYSMQLYPENIGFKIRQANLMLLNNMITEAQEMLASLGKDAESDMWYYYTQAIIASSLDDHKKALEWMERGLKIDPEDEELLMMISQEYISLGNFERAIVFLKKLLELDSTSEFGLNMLASAYENLERYNELETYLTSFVDAHPFNKLAWYHLGKTYRHKFDHEKALDAFDYVLAIDEQYSGALHQKGLIYQMDGNFTSALEAYEEILKFNQVDVFALISAAFCFQKSENYDAAVNYYLKALNIDKDIAQIYIGLANCYFEKEDYSSALNYTLNGLELTEDNLNLLTMAAEIYYVSEDYENAARYFLAALNLEKGDINIWLNYCIVLRELKKEKDAINAIDDELDRVNAFGDKSDFSDEYNIGAFLFIKSAIMFSMGYDFEGEEYFRDAIEYNPYEYTVLFAYDPELEKNEKVLQLVNEFEDQINSDDDDEDDF